MQTSSSESFNRSVVVGGVAGFIATVPMTLIMVWMHKRYLRSRERYPLPPREIEEVITKKVGVKNKLSKNEHTALTMGSHFGYGTFMGSLYQVALGRFFSRSPTINGIFWGMSVWTGSYFGLLPALRILKPASEHPTRRNILMISSHLVWGVSLAWCARLLVRRI